MPKALKRALLLFLIPFLGQWLIRLIYWTCKKEFHIDPTIPKEPFIVAFWHGELLMQPYLYHKIRKKPRIAVMISEHFDGEIISRLIGYFGLESIRGSSKKGAAKVLIAAIRKLQEGYDIAITPDGPRGPRHSVQNGIVVISRKTGASIVAFNCRPSSFWQLASWDRFVIPKPFCTLVFRASAPFGLDGLSDEEAKALVKKRLLENAVL